MSILLSVVRLPCDSPGRQLGMRLVRGLRGSVLPPDARRAATGLKRKERAEQINRALVPLEQGAFSILEGMRIYCGGEEGAHDPLWKLTAYGVSRGLRPLGGWNLIGWSCSARFFAKYPVLDAEKLLAIAQAGTEVFAPEFALSKEQLGSFWQALLPQIPADGSDPVWPDWLCRILEGLCEVEGFFCGWGQCAVLRRL